MEGEFQNTTENQDKVLEKYRDEFLEFAADKTLTDYIPKQPKQPSKSKTAEKPPKIETKTKNLDAEKSEADSFFRNKDLVSEVKKIQEQAIKSNNAELSTKIESAIQSQDNKAMQKILDESGVKLENKIQETSEQNKLPYETITDEKQLKAIETASGFLAKSKADRINQGNAILYLAKENGIEVPKTLAGALSKGYKGAIHTAQEVFRQQGFLKPLEVQNLQQLQSELSKLEKERTLESKNLVKAIDDANDEGILSSRDKIKELKQQIEEKKAAIENYQKTQEHFENLQAELKNLKSRRDSLAEIMQDTGENEELQKRHKNLEGKIATLEAEIQSLNPQKVQVKGTSTNQELSALPASQELPALPESQKLLALPAPKAETVNQAQVESESKSAPSTKPKKQSSKDAVKQQLSQQTEKAAQRLNDELRRMNLETIAKADKAEKAKAEVKPTSKKTYHFDGTKTESEEIQNENQSDIESTGTQAENSADKNQNAQSRQREEENSEVEPEQAEDVSEENSAEETKKATVKVTGDEFGEYADIKELRQKAIQYYKERLQGTSVENKTLGKIEIDENGLVEFTTAGRKKVESTSAQEQKLLLVKYLPNLIENATNVEKAEPIKERHKDDIFYYLKTSAEIDDETVPVNITLVKHNTGRIQFYNHSVELKEDTLVNSATPKKIGNSPVNVSSAENISQSEDNSKDISNLREKLYQKWQVDKFPAIKSLIDNNKLEIENPDDERRMLISLWALDDKYPIKFSPLTKEYEHLNLKRIAEKDKLKKVFYRPKSDVSAEEVYQEYEKFLQEQDGKRNSITYDNENDAEEKAMIKAILDAPVGTKIKMKSSGLGYSGESLFAIRERGGRKMLSAVDENGNKNSPYQDVVLSRANVKKYFGARRLYGTKIGIEKVTVVYPENVSEGNFSAKGEVDSSLPEIQKNLVDESDLTSQQKTFVEWGKSIKMPVKWFKAEKNFWGYHGEDGVSYFNVNAETDLEQLFYHETAHWLAENNRAMFNQILDVAEITDSQRQAKRNSSSVYKNLSDAKLNEEILADNFKDIAKRSMLLQKIGKSDKSLLDKVVSYLKAMLDKFASYFHNPKGGLTTKQRDAMYKEFAKNIRELKDSFGNRYYRINNRTHEVEHFNGTPLAKFDLQRFAESLDNQQNLANNKLDEKIIGRLNDDILNQISDEDDIEKLRDLLSRQEHEDLAKAIKIYDIRSNGVKSRGARVLIARNNLKEAVQNATEIRKAFNSGRVLQEVGTALRRKNKGRKESRLAETLQRRLDAGRIENSAGRLDTQSYGEYHKMYRHKEVKKILDELLNEQENHSEKQGGFSIEDHKQKQLEIIQKTNPMRDDYHTGIRSIEDIKTAEEVFSSDNFEEIYPDFTAKDVQKVLRTGKVKIYSSYPIKNGVFVTPSKMNAQDYAGGRDAKLFSRTVSVNDVAWIDDTQGQFAEINTKHSSQGAFSYAPDDNSNESFFHKAKNYFFGNENLKTRKKLQNVLEDLSGMKIRFGKLEDGIDVVTKDLQKVIRARGVQVQNNPHLIAEVGKQIAKHLNIAQTDEMANYIADFIMTGAPNNTSAEATQFLQAMKELLEARNIMQRWHDLSAAERVRETSVFADETPKKSLKKQLNEVREEAEVSPVEEKIVKQA